MIFLLCNFGECNGNAIATGLNGHHVEPVIHAICDIVRFEFGTLSRRRHPMIDVVQPLLTRTGKFTEQGFTNQVSRAASVQPEIGLVSGHNLIVDNVIILIAYGYEAENTGI